MAVDQHVHVVGCVWRCRNRRSRIDLGAFCLTPLSASIVRERPRRPWHHRASAYSVATSAALPIIATLSVDRTAQSVCGPATFMFDIKTVVRRIGAQRFR